MNAPAHIAPENTDSAVIDAERAVRAAQDLVDQLDDRHNALIREITEAKRNLEAAAVGDDEKLYRQILDEMTGLEFQLTKNNHARPAAAATLIEAQKHLHAMSLAGLDKTFRRLVKQRAGVINTLPPILHQLSKFKDDLDAINGKIALVAWHSTAPSPHEILSTAVLDVLAVLEPSRKQVRGHISGSQLRGGYYVPTSAQEAHELNCKALFDNVARAPEAPVSSPAPAPAIEPIKDLYVMPVEYLPAPEKIRTAQEIMATLPKRKLA
jgi:hypothetical protein